MNKITAKDLNGFTVRHEGKKTYYYNILNRNTYLITNADAPLFQYWSMRYTIGILSAAAGIALFHAVIPSAAAGIILIIISELAYQFCFLKTLTVLKTDHANTANINSGISRMTNDKLILYGILLFFTGVLLVGNAFDSSFQGMLFYTNIALAACISMFGIFLLAVLVRRMISDK